MLKSDFALRRAMLSWYKHIQLFLIRHAKKKNSKATSPLGSRCSYYTLEIVPLSLIETRYNKTALKKDFLRTS